MSMERKGKFSLLIEDVFSSGDQFNKKGKMFSVQII